MEQSQSQPERVRLMHGDELAKGNPVTFLTPPENFLNVLVFHRAWERLAPMSKMVRPNGNEVKRIYPENRSDAEIACNEEGLFFFRIVVFAVQLDIFHF
jgi:hypothetical protein